MSNLKQKFTNEKATLGVVGLGYVGPQLAVEKGKAGFKNIGFDIQKSKVQIVNECINNIFPFRN